jgi:PAB-dependent poly(A)-specific ribonuclease subunit 3
VSGSSFYQTRQPPRQQSQVQPQQPYIPERTLWSYIIQIASAIKKVHERDLAVQMVDVTKILVVGQNRVRIGSCGIVDVFLHDTPQDIRYLQREDLTMFGRLILILCTGNASSFTNSTQVQNALDTINRVYSREMQTLAVFFCSELNKTIDDVLKMVSKKILEEQEEALAAVDRLEDELMGELENARLVRLMAKFGFINERPEYAFSLSLSSLLSSHVAVDSHATLAGQRQAIDISSSSSATMSSTRWMSMGTRFWISRMCLCASTSWTRARMRG